MPPICQPGCIMTFWIHIIKYFDSTTCLVESPVIQVKYFTNLRGKVGSFCLRPVEFYTAKSLGMQSVLWFGPKWVGHRGQTQADVSERPCWRGHKSQLSLSRPYITLSARRYASQIAGIYEWQWHTHSTQAQVPILSNRFCFFSESMK